MILKIIIFAIIALYIYKLFGGKIPSLKDIAKANREKNDLEADTLVECCKCGTYITHKEAIIKGGKFYCDECIGR
jgi:uncharacterized protein